MHRRCDYEREEAEFDDHLFLTGKHSENNDIIAFRSPNDQSGSVFEKAPGLYYNSITTARRDGQK